MDLLNGRSPERVREDLLKTAPGRALLRSISAFYYLAVQLRRLVYLSGLLPRKRLPVPVVCFGNISAGGTGKTSTVVGAARALARAGRKPAILLRGYRREAPANKVVLLRRGRAFEPREAGDEALMLYRMLEADNVPVVVCADRFKGGLEAVREFGCDILLMDDGYQHFALRRDADILLINASAPFLDDGVLPFGHLREPASAAARASAVVFTHCEQADKEGLEALKAGVRRLNPAAEFYESEHEPEHFMDPVTAKAVPLDSMAGRPAAALSGIGDPASFEASLKKMKIKLEQIWRYPDHHAFTREELDSARQAAGEMPIITTYKDLVRFPADWEKTLGGKFLVLSIKISFRGGGWDKLMAFISAVRTAEAK